MLNLKTTKQQLTTLKMKHSHLDFVLYDVWDCLEAFQFFLDILHNFADGGYSHYVVFM